MYLEELANPSLWKKRQWESRFASIDKRTSEKFNPEKDILDLSSSKDKAVELANPKYAEKFREPSRIKEELRTFDPASWGSAILSKDYYDYLVLKYGILLFLVQQKQYKASREKVIEGVQKWEKFVIERAEAEKDKFYNDLLQNLAEACADYKEIDHHELHLIKRVMDHHNKKTEGDDFLGWEDFFKRQASLGNFPSKNTSQSKHMHGVEKIKHATYILTSQALIYDIQDKRKKDIIGIPEDWVCLVKEWLNFELTKVDYTNMLTDVDELNNREMLIHLADKFNLQGARSNEDRINEIVESKVLPSEILESLSENQLRNICKLFRFKLYSGNAGVTCQNGFGEVLVYAVN